MMLQYKAKGMVETKNILSVLLHLKVDYDVFLDYPANRGTITVKPESEALHCAAPKLLAECEEAERALRWAAQEAKGKVRAEVVGGWLHRANRVKAAIAKAKGL